MRRHSSALQGELEKAKRLCESLEKAVDEAKTYEDSHTCPQCEQLLPNCRYVPAAPCCHCAGRNVKVDERDAPDDLGFRCLKCVTICEAKLPNGDRCWRGSVNTHCNRRWAINMKPPCTPDPHIDQRIFCCVCAAWFMASRYDAVLPPCTECIKNQEPLVDDGPGDEVVLMEIYTDASVGNMWELQ